jgi:hypothetical protein
MIPEMAPVHSSTSWRLWLMTSAEGSAHIRHGKTPRPEAVAAKAARSDACCGKSRIPSSARLRRPSQIHRKPNG